MTYTWDLSPTPVGIAVAVLSPEGLVAFHLAEGEPEWEIERVARELGGIPRHEPGALADLDEQLVEYFDGERTAFDVTFDWRLATGFTRDALQTIAQIPYGETASYGEIAIDAGRPRAARAVGTACRLTPFSLVLPVHRVIRSDGSIGEFGAHPETKRFLLDLEGAKYRG